MVYAILAFIQKSKHQLNILWRKPCSAFLDWGRMNIVKGKSFEFWLLSLPSTTWEWTSAATLSFYPSCHGLWHESENPETKSYKSFKRLPEIIQPSLAEFCPLAPSVHKEILKWQHWLEPFCSFDSSFSQLHPFTLLRMLEKMIWWPLAEVVLAKLIGRREPN